MRRREFISLLGSAAAIPLTAHAQQGERVRRIGVLLPSAAENPEYQPWVGAFLQELSQLGWSIGRNVRIDTRWAATNADIRKYAAELVALAPDVILAHGSNSVGQLLQATHTRRDAGGCHCGSHHTHRPSRVQCHSGNGAVAPGGGDPDQQTRCRRDRARLRRPRASLERRSDRDPGPAGDA
jgi:hypothetical protein